jgi:hypothetical protein
MRDAEIIFDASVIWFCAIIYWICLMPSSELSTMAWFILGSMELAVVSAKLLMCMFYLETSEEMSSLEIC